MSNEDTSSFWDELIGSQLSSVEFVQDYLQIRFDGPCLNILNPLTVKTCEMEITSWNPGFRDLVCGQISKIVQNVTYLPEIALVISFTDESELSVSLKSEHYTSPEAFYAHGFNNDEWMVG